LDLTNQGPLILIGMFQTPHSIAETGAVEHERRMCERGSETRQKLAAIAVAAARTQTVRLPGEAAAARLIAELARTAMTLGRQIAQIDELMSTWFRDDPEPK
jgi:hypothetical protein